MSSRLYPELGCGVQEEEFSQGLGKLFETVDNRLTDLVCGAGEFVNNSITPHHTAKSALTKPQRIHRKRRRIALALIVTAIIVALTWWSFSVTVPSYCGNEMGSFVIHYSGTSTGWLSFVHGIPVGCDETYIHVFPGSNYAGSHMLSLRNLDINSPHTLEMVSVSQPFTLVTTSPSMPLVIPAGSYVNVSLQINVPSSPGTYDYFPTGTLFAD